MFVAILAGFTLVTIIHSASYGALETVKTKAARYFSGHISITGYDNGKQVLHNPQDILDKLSAADLPIRTLASRTIYYKNNASLFFAGESIRQRRLIGIDFDREKDELSQLDFLEGSIEDIQINGENGIFISEAAAKILGARTGDDLMLYLTTETGQYNTATLYIRGVFRETSLFGYVAYMRQEDLNRLLVTESTAATDIAVYAEAGVNHDNLLKKIRELLAVDYQVLPFMPNKEALKEQLNNEAGQEYVLAPLTLDAHLDEITAIMDAVLIVTWFVLALFMVIVMIGILNIYRVMVYERTGEIGTLRALGMQKQEVRRMFLFEALLLTLSASFSGFVISFVLMKLIGMINISALPGAGIFTEQGLLKLLINPELVVLTLFLMLGAVLTAALGPANKAAQMTPAEALRAEI
jgi:ABC-type lipoprotein release transport system permease subunit